MKQRRFTKEFIYRMASASALYVQTCERMRAKQTSEMGLKAMRHCHLLKRYQQWLEAYEKCGSPLVLPERRLNLI